MNRYTFENIEKVILNLDYYDLSENNPDYYVIWFEDDIKWKFNDFVNRNKNYSKLLLHNFEITNFISNEKYLEIDEMKEIIPQIDELLQEREIKKDLEMYSILVELKTYLKCAIALKQRVLVFSE